MCWSHILVLLHGGSGDLGGQLLEAQGLNMELASVVLWFLPAYSDHHTCSRHIISETIPPIVTIGMTLYVCTVYGFCYDPHTLFQPFL